MTCFLRGMCQDQTHLPYRKTSSPIHCKFLHNSASAPVWTTLNPAWEKQMLEDFPRQGAFVSLPWSKPQQLKRNSTDFHVWYIWLKFRLGLGRRYICNYCQSCPPQPNLPTSIAILILFYYASSLPPPMYHLVMELTVPGMCWDFFKCKWARTTVCTCSPVMPLKVL